MLNPSHHPCCIIKHNSLTHRASLHTTPSRNISSSVSHCPTQPPTLCRQYCAATSIALRLSATEGSGTALVTSCMAPSRRMPVAWPVTGQRSMTPPYGSGVVGVMPARRNACPLARPMWPSMRVKYAGLPPVMSCRAEASCGLFHQSTTKAGAVGAEASQACACPCLCICWLCQAGVWMQVEHCLLL